MRALLPIDMQNRLGRKGLEDVMGELLPFKENRQLSSGLSETRLFVNKLAWEQEMVGSMKTTMKNVKATEDQRLQTQFSRLGFNI